MSNPLDGVRVLEVAQFTFVPSAGAVLADWGADVVKIEPPTGDPARMFGRMLGLDVAAGRYFIEGEAHAAVTRERNEKLVGCNPSTEREFVAAMVRDLTMDYGRTFADADGFRHVLLNASLLFVPAAIISTMLSEPKE